MLPPPSFMPPGPGRRFWGDRVLLFVFGLPFLLTLAAQVLYVGSLFDDRIGQVEGYGITEWLINYEAGFVRRGLPGSILHGLSARFAFSPSSLIVVVSIALYAFLVVHVWKASRGTIPRWALFTTPLLAYPVYVDDIFIRKDVLILVVFAVAVRLILESPSSPIKNALAALILTAGLLSHELLVFLGLPAVAMLMLISTGLPSGDGSGSIQAPAVPGRRGRFRPFRSLLWLLMPLAGTLGVLIWTGTQAQARRIGASWFDPMVISRPLGIQGGAIGWIGKPGESYIEDTQRMISLSHHGVPTWSIIVLLSAGGVFLVASEIARRDVGRSWFFLVASLFQFTVMVPVFYHAMDSGRWVILCLFTAFLLTVEAPDSLLVWVDRFLPCPAWFRQGSLPAWLCPLFLAFWGMPITFWKPWQFVLNAPVSFPLKTYFYLRILGMPKPTELLG